MNVALCCQKKKWINPQMVKTAVYVTTVTMIFVKYGYSLCTMLNGTHTLN